ncbi:endolysin [Erwinia phage AH04]|uniref:Endolysin n=1 Tax=Erwinia phage AH04 TaxID=2869569 RepID=A0AAE7X2R2_9CAUD|nr:chitinase [Erwinia phage AH04]QZA70737.1 endolysin [Erwinia phage AH04]
MTNSVKDESVLKSLQTSLAKLSLYGGRVDGLFGDLCRKAVITMLNKAFPSVKTSTLPGNTYDANSVYTFLQTGLARAGLYTITIDGKWGPTSQGAFDKLSLAYTQAIKKSNGETMLPLQPATVVPTHVNEAQLKLMLSQDAWGKIASLLDPMNKCMDMFDITSGLRKAHFMAQILHETASFKYSEEIASGAAYEGRADLGNTQPGDGKLFKGRGWLQLTGRLNYLKCETFLRQHLNDPSIDLTSSATAAAQVANNPLYSALASGYFWGYIKPKLNPTADKDDIFWVSVYVNGWAKQAKPYYPNKDLEPNGMADRVAKLAIAKQAFGLI